MAPSRQLVVVAMAAVLVLQLTSGVLGADVCPYRSELVYPYAAWCGQGTEGAAVYYGKEVYEVGVTSIIGSIQGRLAPEWDETNSTFYVRSAQVGAKYKFSHKTREYRGFVSQFDRLSIVNAETERPLGWRREGENEWFLVEVDYATSTNSSVISFQFARAPFASLPLCNFVEPQITCEAYYILNAGTSLGLTPYVENGVTYFTLSSVPDFSTFPPVAQSFLLLRDTSSMATSA